jgi:hypothetical protein
MSEMDKATPAWVDRLCRIAFDFRTAQVSIRDLFVSAAPDLRDPRLPDLLRDKLASEPPTVEAWLQYSNDKRGAPSPYMDGVEVGFADLVNGRLDRRDVRRHSSGDEACADFIHREALWVLERRQPGDRLPPGT